MTSRLERLRIVLSSAVIVAAIGAQLAALLVRRLDTFPFYPFPMYAQSYPAGPIEAVRARAFVRRSGKKREPIRAAWGYAEDAFRTEVLSPLARGDETVARRLIAERNEGRAGDPVRFLRVDVERYRIPPRAPLEVERTTVVFHCDDRDGTLVLRTEVRPTGDGARAPAR